MITEERRSGRMPIRPGHVLYPIFAIYALVSLAFGPAQPSADSTDEETHPYFPDHFWPYAILAMASLILLGLLAYIGQPLLNPTQSADPRAAIIPRPEWYFLALFVFAKFGPGLITTVAVPLALVIGLVAWPFLDAGLGPRIARRLKWRSWPAPKRNMITGGIWLVGLWIVGLLTLWAAFAPQLCIPWPFNGPVCGA